MPLIHVFSNYFRALESSNAIDSTSNLASSKVYIVHGSEDTVVDPLFAVKIKEFYEGYNVNQVTLISKLIAKKCMII